MNELQELIEGLKARGVDVNIKNLSLDFTKHDKAYIDKVDRLNCEIDELSRENDELKSERMLPDNPIEVAQMLITATAEYKSMFFERATFNIYGISELKQIAEHLLVYCNNNKEE